ncbi:MAG TPA: SLBB domain-containing protein, partial [Acidimicrobiia bacterium]|nr:SLBB domain-containing protein [Acidimicrobiia bacterium]
MVTTHALSPRILPRSPITSLAQYLDLGGGLGLEAARRLGPDGVVEHLLASGLRGRGGAGFPTGRKWATVRAYETTAFAPTVVVNAAEGEPGSFKDRSILRANAYAVLEGALIAAGAVGADRVIVALKHSFTRERDAVARAITEVRDANWCDGIILTWFEGPSEYLYGEETALLEAIDERPPFPRIQPPYRYGVEEVSDNTSGEPAQVVMAAGGETIAPPTLVNNTETMANVPGILAHGPVWFREVGTDASPGSIVCTITGCTNRHGVAEVPMGTPLRDAIEMIGGGARPGRRLIGAMSGVANPVIPEALLDTPLTYETMDAIGS